MGMTKSEAIAYLRKKKLQEKLEAEFVPTVTEEAEEELRNMEEKASTDLTTAETSV
jgi:broad-specificity NMP kinase